MRLGHTDMPVPDLCSSPPLKSLAKLSMRLILPALRLTRPWLQDLDSLAAVRNAVTRR